MHCIRLSESYTKNVHPIGCGICYKYESFGQLGSTMKDLCNIHPCDLKLARAFLCEHFAPKNKELLKLIGQDLSHWK